MITMPKTADDWELYALAGCDKAARALSKALERALRANSTQVAFDIWYTTANKWAKFGACDTEPRNIALDVINWHFKSDNGHFESDLNDWVDDD